MQHKEGRSSLYIDVEDVATNILPRYTLLYKITDFHVLFFYWKSLFSHKKKNGASMNRDVIKPYKQM